MAWDQDIPDVVAGQPITSAWGNLIRDRAVHVVATVAALPADVANGSVAYVTADGLLYIRHTGRWWVRKSIQVTRTCDAAGLVVLAPADCGMLTFTFATGHVSVAANPATSAWSGTSWNTTTLNIRTYTFTVAGGVVGRPNAVSLVINVYAEGFVT